MSHRHHPPHLHHLTGKIQTSPRARDRFTAKGGLPTRSMTHASQIEPADHLQLLLRGELANAPARRIEVGDRLHQVADDLTDS
jgi:hypothetical protein